MSEALGRHGSMPANNDTTTTNDNLYIQVPDNSKHARYWQTEKRIMISIVIHITKKSQDDYIFQLT
jgi:hypothetical protein